MQVKKSKKKKPLNAYIKYSSLTIQIAIIIVAGSLFGSYLDEKKPISIPIYTIIFSLTAIFFALYYVLKKINNKDEIS